MPEREQIANAVDALAADVFMPVGPGLFDERQHFFKSQRFVLIKTDITRHAHCLATELGVAVLGKGLQIGLIGFGHRHDLADVRGLPCPEPGDTVGPDRSGRLAVGQGLVRHDGLGQRGGTEFFRQRLVIQFGEVGHADGFLLLMFDAPDAAADFVAVGMGARHFVVADDLVVPVDNVHTAVRAKSHGDGTEPRVVAGHEIADFLKFPIAEIMIRTGFSHRFQLHGVDAVGDRIGDEHQVVVGSRVGTLLVGQA